MNGTLVATQTLADLSDIGSYRQVNHLNAMLLVRSWKTGGICRQFRVSLFEDVVDRPIFGSNLSGSPRLCTSVGFLFGAYFDLSFDLLESQLYTGFS